MNNRYLHIKYNNVLTALILVSPYEIYSIIRIGVFYINLFQIFTIILSITLLFDILMLNKALYIKELTIIYVILLYNLLEIFISPDIQNSHMFTMSFGMIFLIICYIVINPTIKFSYNIIIIYLYSSIIPILIGFYQWIYNLIYGRFPGVPFHFLIVSEGKAGITFNKYLRITSTFSDPNYYGAYLVTIVILSFGIIYNNIIYNKIYNKNTMRNISIIFVSSLFALAQTLSLTSLMGSVFGILLMLITVKKRIEIKNIFKIIGIMFILLIMIVLLDKILNYNIINIILFKYNTQYLKYGLTFGRAEYFNNALKIFMDNPLFGTGFGGLSIKYGIGSSAHNTLLTILGEQGIIGFLLHIIFLFMPFILFIKKCKKSNIRNLGVIVFSSIFGFIIVSLGYDLLYKIDSIFILFVVYYLITKNYQYCYE